MTQSQLAPASAWLTLSAFDFFRHCSFLFVAIALSATYNHMLPVYTDIHVSSVCVSSQAICVSGVLVWTGMKTDSEPKHKRQF